MHSAQVEMAQENENKNLRLGGRRKVKNEKLVKFLGVVNRNLISIKT